MDATGSTAMMIACRHGTQAHAREMVRLLASTGAQDPSLHTCVAPVFQVYCQLPACMRRYIPRHSTKNGIPHLPPPPPQYKIHTQEVCVRAAALIVVFGAAGDAPLIGEKSQMRRATIAQHVISAVRRHEQDLLENLLEASGKDMTYVSQARDFDGRTGLHAAVHERNSRVRR